MSNSSSHTIKDVSGINYVIAIIRLPLEIHPDGTFTTLNDNIDLEFIPINELPTKKENGIEMASIELDGILGLFNTKKNETTTTKKNDSSHIIGLINIDKRIKRIRNKNMTFKNNSSNKHNYSTKSWK